MKSAGNFVFGDPTKPAITVQTGAEYGVLYAAPGKTGFALGFTGVATQRSPLRPSQPSIKNRGQLRYRHQHPKTHRHRRHHRSVARPERQRTIDGKHASSFALSGFADLAYTPTPTFDGGAANTFKITLKGQRDQLETGERDPRRANKFHRLLRMRLEGPGLRRGPPTSAADQPPETQPSAPAQPNLSFSMAQPRSR